tara:strand:+ start:289 stop:576 length:288 start_codon:yes stop_codon:yes gene_type:complete
MNTDIKNKLRKIFNNHDPIGIYCDKETNFDEYDPEIEGLIIRFNRSKNLDDFTSKIHTVFVNMFDKDIAGPKSKYNKLAKEVYNLLSKESKNKKL